MHYLRRIVRVLLALKTQVFREIAHRLIGNRIYRVHALDPMSARNVYEMLHQQRREPLIVPLVANRYSAFATQPVGARTVATDADFTLVCAIGQQSDKRHFTCRV